MDDPKNRILEFLIERAPNNVSEKIIERELKEFESEKIARALDALVTAESIGLNTDIRGGKQASVNYYYLLSYKDIPVRENIRIGEVSVQRLLSTSSVTYLPEDFNDAIESLAKYADGLEERFKTLVAKEQQKYWVNLISIFGVFIAILAFILVGLPKIETNPTMTFGQIVAASFAQIVPVAIVLVIFIVLLRWIIKD